MKLLENIVSRKVLWEFGDSLNGMIQISRKRKLTIPYAISKRVKLRHLKNKLATIDL